MFEEPQDKVHNLTDNQIRFCFVTFNVSKDQSELRPVFISTYDRFQCSTQITSRENSGKHFCFVLFVAPRYIID